MNMAVVLLNAIWTLAKRRGDSEFRSWSHRKPYTGAELRAIRKRNGVGRPPSVNLRRMSAFKQ